MSSATKNHDDDIIHVTESDIQDAPPPYEEPIGHNHLSLGHASTRGLLRQKRWSSSLTRCRSAMDMSALCRQGVEWTESQARELFVNATAGAVEVYTATQMAAIGSFDRWITSIDEGLFLSGNDSLKKGCPVHHGWRTTDNSRGRSAKDCTCLSKVNLYQNSRLPPDLPPLLLDPSAHEMVSLAAQFSHRAYQRSARADEQSYVAANLRHGTKAMVLDASAVDSMATVVLALRGTQSFRDWFVNMQTEPTPPEGFLDDPSNACHAGFLQATKRMVRPVTDRLRRLLDDNPHYESYALLITGHSAGGAVASLLYCHLLATQVSSELTALSSRFQRVHCVTFGAPPCAERPLFPSPSPQSEHSLFYAFINEGDPVPRADKTYVRSLLSLYATPAPSSVINRTYDAITGKVDKSFKTHWKIPRGHLSLAGQLVALRRKRVAPDVPIYTGPEEIDACLTTDDVLRQTVFGDTALHMMRVYAARVDCIEMMEPRTMQLGRRAARKMAVRKAKKSSITLEDVVEISTSQTGYLPAVSESNSQSSLPQGTDKQEKQQDIQSE